jgi:DNA-binding NarL/FixJ family response regulator
VYKVYVVTCDPLVRLGVGHLIGTNERIHAIIPVDSVTDVPDICVKEENRPAVAVLVNPLPHALRWACARHATLVMVPEAAVPHAIAAIRAGAHAVVATAATPAQMRIALDVTAARGFYLCQVFSGKLRQDAATMPAIPSTADTDMTEPPMLAPREVETLDLIARGLTHAEAARRLNLAEATVNTYIMRVRTKLGARNKAELIRKAIAFGWVDGPLNRPTRDTDR